MEPRDPTPLTDDLRVLAEQTEAAAGVGLNILLGEMLALAAVLPAGLSAPHTPRTDAEIEADFDNMPV